MAVIEQLEKRARTEPISIIFSEKEASELSHPHDDPLVILAIVANFQTSRILVGNGSSVDVLYWRAFEKMNIGKKKLHPIYSPLIGFAGDRVEPRIHHTPNHLGNRAKISNQNDKFPCDLLPFGIQRYTWMGIPQLIQGDSLDSLPIAQISYQTRSWCCKGESKGGKGMLRLVPQRC